MLQLESGSNERRYSRRSAVSVSTLAIALVLLAGCADASKRPPRKSGGAAIWINTSSEALQPNLVSKLKEAGVEEVFLQAGKLDGGTGTVAASLGDLSLPGSLACTLVISGALKSGGEPQTIAGRMLDAFRELQIRVEQEDTLVVGLHLDLTSVDSFEAYGQLLTELRKELSPKLFLSVSVQRSWIGEPSLGLVLEPVDFFVPFLFGQRVDEREDPNAWDLTNVERSLRSADNLGRPYLLGIVDLGTATWSSQNGNVKERVTRISMKELIRNQDLQLKPGFSLEGTNRRVYTFEAQRKTQVGAWSLVPEDSIRVVRLASADLEELLRRLDLWANKNRIGQLYYRIPNPEERLSFGAESLAAALKLDSKGIDLSCEVTVQRRTGRGWLVRFTLVNNSGGFSELALLDNNFIEVESESGHFEANVDPGDFQRFDLLKDIAGRKERTFRSPDILRLYSPMLEGQQQMMSGDIEVVTTGAPTFRIAGSFLLPDGRSLEVGPFSYSNGTMQKISQTTTE